MMVTAWQRSSASFVSPRSSRPSTIATVSSVARRAICAATSRGRAYGRPAVRGRALVPTMKLASATASSSVSCSVAAPVIS